MSRNSTPLSRERSNRGDDVVGADRHVLDARAAIKVEILLDLRFLLALRRLVDRKLHAVARVGHHLRAQRGVFGRDVLVVERDQLREAEDASVEVAPRVHLAPADVADAVIDELQAGLARVPMRLARLDEARHEDPGVAVALDERVHGVAVGGDRRPNDAAVCVVETSAAAITMRAPPRDRHLERGARVFDHDRDVFDAVAVQHDVPRDLVVRHQARRQHEAQIVLLEQIADAISHAGLRTRVRDLIEAERRHVIVRRLLRVADVELDVVPVDLCQRIAARFGAVLMAGGLGEALGRRPCRSEARR